MKKLILLPLVLFSILCFGQIKNAGFENWDTVDTTGYKQLAPNNWKASSLNGVERITDSISGNNSIMLHTWYFYSTTSIYQTDSLNFRPAYLRGYYKNIPGGENKPSKGIATVLLTKTHGKIRDTIAKGNIELDTSSTFIPFQVHLNYKSDFTPDSFFIHFDNRYVLCKGGSCGFVYLDDIAFVPFTNLSIQSSKKLPSINLYPNPANDILNIENKSGDTVEFQLFNSLGICVTNRTLINAITHIELTSLPSGMYFYNLTSIGETFKTGKLIKI